MAQRGQESMKSLARIKQWVDDKEPFFPMDFVRCQWQRSSTSWLWLIYKFVVMLWFIEALLMSITVAGYSFNFWCIYYTHWSFALATLQACMALILVLMNQCGKFEPEGGPNQDRFCKAYQWIFVSALVQALTVSIIYWTLVFNPKTQSKPSPLHFIENTQVHFFNSVFLLLDVALTAFPIPMIAFLLPFFVTLVYIIFNAAYILSGGLSPKGEPYVYSVLDWKKPAIAIPLSIGCSLAIIAIHFMCWGMIYGRRKFAAHREQRRVNRAFERSARA